MKWVAAFQANILCISGLNYSDFTTTNWYISGGVFTSVGTSYIIAEGLNETKEVSALFRNWVNEFLIGINPHLHRGKLLLSDCSRLGTCIRSRATVKQDIKYICKRIICAITEPSLKNYVYIFKIIKLFRDVSHCGTNFITADRLVPSNIFYMLFYIVPTRYVY